MIVDSSAILAILLGEPEAGQFTDAILSAPCRMAAPTWFEIAMNVDKLNLPEASQRFDDLIAAAGITIMNFSPEHAQAARLAWRRYGRGRHPAKLNFGDCMVYAVAKVEHEPLLFKGDDFSQTDVEPALKD